MNSFLNSLQRSIGIAFIIIVIGIICVVSLRTLGYYIDEPGWYVAEELVKKGKSVKSCRKILLSPFAIFGPPLGARRMDCIHRYAKLTKDPPACELLMPSSYGLDCVGGTITARKTCNLNENTVSWWEDEEKEIVGRVSFESCQSDDASGTVKRNQCCLIARVTRVRGQNDCSPLTNDRELHDECIAGLAFKNRDPNACGEIHDANLRSACTVRTKAMKENPAICDGCREPVNDLSELK